jgi:hypothetical protein
MKTARELYLPEPGSPHWVPRGEPPGGLLYLAWGRRYYGRDPIPQRLHHGWTYMVVLAGHPLLLAGEQRRKLSPGSLIVAGPDVPYGPVAKPLPRQRERRPGRWQSASPAEDRNRSPLKESLARDAGDPASQSQPHPHISALIENAPPIQTQQQPDNRPPFSPLRGAPWRDQPAQQLGSDLP